MEVRDQYFATLPTEEVGEEIYTRVNQFYQSVDSSGYFEMLRKSFYAYYGMSYNENATGEIFQSNVIRRGGTQGERYNFKINQYRNLLQHLLVLTTSERLAYEAMAENTDSESQAQAELAEGLLDNFLTEKRLERTQVDAVETCLWGGSGYLSATWDVKGGRRYGRDPDGNVQNEGDLRYESLSPLDVIFDPNKNHWKTDWKIIRRYENRHDLVAMMPDLAEEIENVEEKHAELEKFRFVSQKDVIEPDDIPVYEFHHKRTPAVPDGRLVTILPGGKVIFDGPLPYHDLPIYTLQPYNIKGTPYGYTPAFDLLSIQDAFDMMASTVLSNQATFGIQNIWLPKGHGLNYTQLADGLSVIETDPAVGKPEPLQMTATPPELFGFLRDLSQWMEQISGLNSVVRGNPEGQLKGASGSAMALLASQAIQFNHGLQREYEFFSEDVGTGSIKILQEYASTPRVAQITGKAKRSYLKEFKGDDVGRVTRVRIKRTSAMSKTTSGKLTLGDNLLEKGQIGPHEYLNLIETGNLETATESPMSRLNRIKSENEKMRLGEIPVVLRTDPHQLDIEEHLTVLDDPEVRNNPKIVNAVLTHIQQHEAFLQPPAPPAPGPQQQGTDSGAPNPQRAAGGAMGGQQMARGEAMPNQPNMPRNPLSGETQMPPGDVPAAGDVPQSG